MKKIALILALALCALTFAACGAGYEKTIQTYIDAIMEKDGELFLKTVDPYAIENKLEQYDLDDDETDKLAKEFKTVAKNTLSSLEDRFSDDIGDLEKITFEISDVTEYEKDELEILAEWLDDEYGYDADEIQAIALLEVEFTYVGDEDEDDEDAELAVIKIDGKWYRCEYFLNEDHIDSILDEEDK